jgi:trk system potassium uptake protein
MIYMLLMWIGASPSSTGGGIKTTVIAVAFLNLKSIMFGKDRSEVFKTEISQTATNRAFAIIFISLFILGITVLLLSFYDSDKALLPLAFEAFSAFATVGLTLGITPDLSSFSKLVLTLVMLTVTPASKLAYRYPKEDILL